MLPNCGPSPDNIVNATVSHTSAAEMLIANIHMIWNTETSALQITWIFSPWGELQTNAVPEENKVVVCWLIHDVV